LRSLSRGWRFGISGGEENPDINPELDGSNLYGFELSYRIRCVTVWTFENTDEVKP
jgi:hypothetical protein